MTTVYFVRHAEPNYSNHVDAERELTPKGMEDRKRVTAYLLDKSIDAVLSSPFRRAVDTVAHFAETRGLPVRLVDGFRERRIGAWLEDYGAFARRQWADFTCKLPGGESLSETQDRNIAALKDVLREFEGKNVVIGSHGTALCTVIHYYDRTFGYEDFEVFRDVMPWIVKFVFDGERFKTLLTV